MKPVSGNQSIPLLVTNEHVVRDAQKGFIELIKKRDDFPKK